MKLSYRPHAVKQLKKIPIKDKRKVVKNLEALINDPTAGKKLKGELEGLRSLRAWPYRIIYEVLKSEIVVLSVAHRQGAY